MGFFFVYFKSSAVWPSQCAGLNSVCRVQLLLEGDNVYNLVQLKGTISLDNLLSERSNLNHWVSKDFSCEVSGIQLRKWHCLTIVRWTLRLGQSKVLYIYIFLHDLRMSDSLEQILYAGKIAWHTWQAVASHRWSLQSHAGGICILAISGFSCPLQLKRCREVLRHQDSEPCIKTGKTDVSMKLLDERVLARAYKRGRGHARQYTFCARQNSNVEAGYTKFSYIG